MMKEPGISCRIKKGKVCPTNNSITIDRAIEGTINKSNGAIVGVRS